MFKKFLSVIIPITFAVIARTLLFSKKPQSSNFVVDSVVSRFPHDDKVDCFLDSTIDNLKIKVQFMCGSQPRQEIDEKLDSIQCYIKALDHGVYAKLEITHGVYLPNRSAENMIERFLNRRTVNRMGTTDSISRVKVSGIEGVRHEFEIEPRMEDGIKGYVRHLCYYLIYKGHILVLDYSVGGRKVDMLYTADYYQKCEPIFENMIINTQLSVL